MVTIENLLMCIELICGLKPDVIETNNSYTVRVGISNPLEIECKKNSEIDNAIIKKQSLLVMIGMLTTLIRNEDEFRSRLNEISKTSFFVSNN